MPKNLFVKSVDKSVEKAPQWVQGLWDGKSTEERTKEKAREWQRQIRGDMRHLDRDINKIRQEETKLTREIEFHAKKGNLSSVRTLAQQVVRSKKAIGRLERVKCSLSAVNLHLTTATATMATATSIKMSAKVMKDMNRLMDVPELQGSMQKMRKEMAKAEIVDEMIEESFADSDVEDEVDVEVAKVLDELHLDTAQIMAGAGHIQIPTGVSTSEPTSTVGAPLQAR